MGLTNGYWLLPAQARSWKRPGRVLRGSTLPDQDSGLPDLFLEARRLGLEEYFLGPEGTVIKSSILICTQVHSLCFIKLSISEWMQTQKKTLKNCASNFLLFLPFFNLCVQKWKSQRLRCAAPNTDWNMQQLGWGGNLADNC